MNSVLETIYNNDFNFENITSSDPEYKVCKKKLITILDTIRDELCEQDYHLLDDLSDNFYSLSSLDCYEHFAYGFKLGTQLMHEVFSNNE